MAPGLGLGPVSTGLVLVVELRQLTCHPALAGGHLRGFLLTTLESPRGFTLRPSWWPLPPGSEPHRLAGHAPKLPFASVGSGHPRTTTSMPMP